VKRLLALVTLALLPLSLSTCKAGAVGDAIEPDKPTAADAVGELECRTDQSMAEPLIVDWGSDDRTDLEISMRDGIVVAAYDCNSFRVLENCQAGSGYKFAGVGRKEDVIQIVGQDELHANFPLGAAKFEAGLDRSSAIDIALVTVGKHRALTAKVSRVDLDGDCDGATHFVRSAVVGAFAVGTGTRGHAAAVAEVFKIGDVGGSSTSEQQSLNKDGDLAACAAANPGDEAPPPQCQSLLRVELVALVEAPVDPEAQAAPGDAPLGNVCTAEGFVWDGKKCTKASEAKGYRCNPQDVAECKAQCDAGNADSCYNLAGLTMMGKAGGPADKAAATALYEKACAGDSLAACSSLTWQLDWKTEGARVIGLLQKSCDGGRTFDCRTLGIELIRGLRLTKDEARGEKLLAGACSSGDPFACGDLGLYYLEQKQASRALGVVQKDCEAGNGGSCAKMGGWLSRCEDGRPPGMSPSEIKSCEKFPDTNAKNATLAFESSCRAKYFGACRVAGDRYAAGKGLPADTAKAFELYGLGCPYGMGSCEALGRSYEKGEGVTADLTKAYDAYAKGCDGAGKGDCYEAARVAKKLGNDTDYRARLEKGCTKMSRRSCDELTKLLEKEKKTEDAKTLYGDICNRMRDQAYCDAFKRLGGELPADFKPFKPRKDRLPDDF
jgi:TPR repeat protein